MTASTAFAGSTPAISKTRCVALRTAFTRTRTPARSYRSVATPAAASHASAAGSSSAPRTLTASRGARWPGARYSRWLTGLARLTTCPRWSIRTRRPSAARSTWALAARGVHVRMPRPRTNANRRVGVRMDRHYTQPGGPILLASRLAPIPCPLSPLPYFPCAASFSRAFVTSRWKTKSVSAFSDLSVKFQVLPPFCFTFSSFFR